MGTFLIPIQVGDLVGSRFLTMDAMVDTGAVYTLIPEDKRDGLTLESEQTREFVLADENVVEYAVGYARIRFEQAEVIAPVIIGAEGSMPLLGATALGERSPRCRLLSRASDSSYRESETNILNRLDSLLVSM